MTVHTCLKLSVEDSLEFCSQAYFLTHIVTTFYVYVCIFEFGAGMWDAFLFIALSISYLKKPILTLKISSNS